MKAIIMSLMSMIAMTFVVVGEAQQANANAGSALYSFSTPGLTASQTPRRGVYAIEISADLSQLHVGDEVAIHLPELGDFGRTINAVIDDTRRTTDHGVNQRTVLSGYLRGDESAGAGLTVVVGPTAVYAHIITANGNLLVEPDSSGKHWLIDEREAGFVYRGMGDDASQGEDTNTPPDSQQDEAQSSGSRQAPTSAVTGDDPTRQSRASQHDITLMVLYSAGFAARHRDPVGRIEQMIAIANQAFANSGVNAQLSATHFQQVDYPDTEPTNVTLDIMRASQGAFEFVDDLRAAKSADLVTFVRADYSLSESCGRAYLPNSIQPTSLTHTYGFSTIYARSPGLDGCPDWVLAHEIGHNFGADHDRETGCQGLTHYACGQREIPFFKTLMAYGPPELNLNVFSSPLLDCGGRPCGIAQGSSGAADNAQILRVMAPTLAQYAPGTLGVQRPMRGEQFAAGAVFNVTWTTLGVSGTRFDITLWRGDEKIAALADNVAVATDQNVICTGANCGSWVSPAIADDSARDYCTGSDCTSVISKSYPVSLPQQLVEADDYRIRVVSTANSAIESHSAEFSVRTTRLIVFPEREVAVSELGLTDSVAVALNAPVSSDVIVNIVSSDTSEGVVSPNEIVFTPANWQISQTITIEGVDDNSVDGDKRFAVMISPLVSEDPYFNGIDPPDIAAINFDAEPDRDRDGFADEVDAFPTDPLEHRDTDDDGIGDRVDDDDDGDGIPDAFEISYGLDHLDPNDRGLDPDGDNLSNWEEYLFSGHPFQADDDADRDGAPNIADSAPEDPTNNGKIKLLTIDKTFSGKYGNGYGKNRYFSVAMFTFEQTNEDLLIGAVGFDIDTADEVSVLMNGQPIGYLTVTDNKALAARPDYFYVATRDQHAGTNTLQFIQKTPGFMWGVTDVSLNAVTITSTQLDVGKKEQRGFGARFGSGNIYPAVRFAFNLEQAALTQPYQLSLKAYGVETEGDAKVYVNSRLVGILRRTSGAKSKTNRINLPLDVLQRNNVIEIVHTEPAASWGVTDLKVSAMNDIVKSRAKFAPRPPNLSVLN